MLRNITRRLLTKMYDNNIIVLYPIVDFDRQQHHTDPRAPSKPTTHTLDTQSSFTRALALEHVGLMPAFATTLITWADKSWTRQEEGPVF